MLPYQNTKERGSDGVTVQKRCGVMKVLMFIVLYLQISLGLQHIQSRLPAGRHLSIFPTGPETICPAPLALRPML